MREPDRLPRAKVRTTIASTQAGYVQEIDALEIGWSAVSLGAGRTKADQEVDPQTVTQEGPFSEPGLREVAEGKYDAYIVAQTFSYTPGLLEIPVGAEVTFYVTSIDVQHGFNIRDTNINMQIVPGQVSKLTHTFEEPGEFPFICTEYCGSQHHAMFGTIRVVSGTGAEG